MASDSTIFIDLGKPLTPSVWTFNDKKFEDGKTDDNSVYRVLAEKFLPMVADVVNDEGSNYKYGDKEYFKLEKIFERQKVGEHNNIISILGNRGTGKSSILRSIPYLFDHKKWNIHNDVRADVKLNALDNCYFLPLPIIDPSAFKENDTLLESFVSVLFTIFQVDITEPSKSSESKKTDSEETRELIKAFKEIRKALQAARLEASKVLGGDVNDNTYTDLQALEHLSSGNNLRKKLGYLVNTFIKWHFGVRNDDDKTKYYLILSVDDLDLFSGKVIQVLEDLRSLIQIPGLIVTTAFRFEQLMEEVEVFYINRFKELFSNYSGHRGSLSESPSDMSGKYLVKIFPINRRISTKDIATFSKVEILGTSSFKISNNERNSLIFNNIESVFLRLFYSRTGIILQPKLYGNTHPLMPNSIREMIQFIKYFLALKDVFGLSNSNDCNAKVSVKTSKDYDNLIFNLNFLKEEWIHQFAMRNISSVFRNFVFNFFTIGIDVRNKYVIREFLLCLHNYNALEKLNFSRVIDDALLAKEIPSIIDGIYSEDDIRIQFGKAKDDISLKSDVFDLSYEEIVKNINLKNMVSFGDVNLVLFKLLNIYLHDKDVILVISLIKIYYSIDFTKSKYWIDDKAFEFMKFNLNTSILIGNYYINPFYLDVVPKNSQKVSRSFINFSADFAKKTSFIFKLSILYGQVNSNFRVNGKLNSLKANLPTVRYKNFSLFQFEVGLINFFDIIMNSLYQNKGLNNLKLIDLFSQESTSEFNDYVIELIEGLENYKEKFSQSIQDYGIYQFPLNSIELIEYSISQSSYRNNRNVASTGDASIANFFKNIDYYLRLSFEECGVKLKFKDFLIYKYYVGKDNVKELSFEEDLDNLNDFPF